MTYRLDASWKQPERGGPERATTIVLLMIALLATLAVCVQNADALPGFVWAAIHGVGAASLRALLPAAIGLAIVWAGYVFLRRRNVPRRALVFAMYVLCVVLVNEALLPSTPLKAWRRQRGAEAVEVRNIRDEVVLSAHGNPIGIRLTFEAVFPRAGAYLIGPSVLTPAEDDQFWPMSFDHSQPSVIEPPPSRGESSFDRFDEQIVYTVTTELMPNFLSYDAREKVPCLNDVTSQYISEADFLSALSRSRSLKYRGGISVNGVLASQAWVVGEYVTSRAYDIQAMYQTIQKEGNGRCGS